MALIITIGGRVIATNADHRVSANGLEYANAIGQRDTLTMVIESPNGSYRPEIGASISAVDTAIGLEFGGTIRALDTDQHGDGGLTHTIGCASWEQLFDRRTTGVYEYPAQRADLIVAALLANNMGGDNIGASILQTGPVIGPVTFDFISVRRALDAVCEYASSGEDTWVWDCPVISGVRTLRFYKQDTYPAPYDCTSINHNIKRPIHISYALDENYGNRVYVRMGEYIRDSEPQTFTATAGQTVFSCDYPLAGTPSVTVDGAPKTVGVRDVDTLKDCYWNLDSKDVEFVVPMTGGESIVVTYQGKDAKVFDAVSDSSEIDARAAAEGDTTGYFVAVIDVSTAGGTSAAQAAADAWLAVHASIPSTVTYPSSAPGLRAGMYQTVNQPAFGINAAYVIKSVTLTRGNGRWLWNVSAVRGNLAGDWMAKLRKLAVGPVAAGVSIGTPPIPFTYGDTTIPSSFTFGVTASALDPTVAEISGLSFSSPSNHNSVSAGTFTFFYVDESATPAFLTGDVTLGASSMDVDSATGLEGKYVEIDGEIVLCGTPSGSTVPITRAQLGSSADAHSTGAAVRLCMTVVQTVTFAAGFFSTAAAADWVLKCALPNQKLVAVTGSVTNAYGNSPLATVCLTANSAHGLRLDAPSSAGTAWTVVAPAVNADRTLSASDGDQIINVTATSRDCTITLPPETSMEGRHVTVNRAPGSTYNVYIAPGSTYTIDSSGTSKTLDDTGTQWSGVGAGSDNWITTSITGDFTVPATPDAPNVTGSSTFEVAYVDQDGADATNGGYMLPRGVFYLPTTDPNYAHLVAVDVRLVIDSAAPIVARFPGPWSGNTQAWRWPAPLPRPTSNGAVTAEYIAINDDGHASSSPVTFTAVTITGQPIAPAQPTGAATLTEIGPRVKVNLGKSAGLIATTMRIAFASGVDPRTTRAQVAIASGGVELPGQIIDGPFYPVVGGHVDFPAWVPESAASWVGKASAASDTAVNPWSTAVSTSAYSMTAIAVAAANIVTGGTVGAIIDHPGAVRQWSVPISFTINATDINLWITKIYRVVGKYVGGVFTPMPGSIADPLHNDPGITQVEGAGAQSFEWGPHNYEPPAGYPIVRLYLAARSRRGGDADESGWTLQANAFGVGVDYYDIDATTPSGGDLDFSHAQPDSLGAGSYIDAAGKFASPGGNTDNLVLDGSFESGGLTQFVSYNAGVWSGGTAYTGNYAVGLVAGTALVAADAFNGSNAHVAEKSLHIVRPGEKYRASCIISYPAGNDGFFVLITQRYDGVGNCVSESHTVHNRLVGGEGWVEVAFDETVPASGVSKLQVIAKIQGETVGKNWYLDSLCLKPIIPGAQVQKSGGFTNNPNGDLALVPGATIDLDGSGKPVVKLGTLTQPHLVPGSLSDPNGGAWGSTGGPTVVYAGLPSYTTYNLGQVLFNTVTGKLYKRGASGWINMSDPGDLIAGQIAAGVVYAGNVAASQVTAGTFTGFAFVGCTLTLTSGTQQWKINSTDGILVTDSSVNTTVQIKLRSDSGGILGVSVITAAIPGVCGPYDVNLGTNGTALYRYMNEIGSQQDLVTIDPAAIWLRHQVKTMGFWNTTSEVYITSSGITINGRAL